MACEENNYKSGAPPSSAKDVLIGDSKNSASAAPAKISEEIKLAMESNEILGCKKSSRRFNPNQKGCSTVAGVNGRKERMRRRVKCEELYTDKDRAAAVNVGARDIKHSLKLKRQQDRSKTLHIPEEANPAQFLALGHYEMKKKEIEIALSFINKALELNPGDKNSLVARSKCHLMLGQPEKGLEDAEAALAIDKKFLKAICQKAESLYYLGDFEYSLMFFHRGLHLRPDHEECKLGAEKARRAIEAALDVNNIIKKTQSRISSRDKGGSKSESSATSSLPAAITASLGNDNDDEHDHENNAHGTQMSMQKTPTNRVKTHRRGLLKELAVDKEYLENLLTMPHMKTAESKKLLGYVENTVEYLNKRQEFWRQQLPPSMKKRPT